jgi:hypothetical protein
MFSSRCSGRPQARMVELGRYRIEMPARELDEGFH